MKKRLIIISSFVLLVIGFSYVLRQKYVVNIQDDNDSIIAIEKKLKEKYTSVSRNGEGTVDEPYYFEVEQNGKKGICDGQGNEVISPKYDCVSKKEGYYILKDSNVTAPKHDLGPTEEKLYVLKDGKTTALKHISKPCWYLVMLDGKNGACDSTGRLIIPPVYENLDRYSHGEYHTEFKGVEFRINLNDPEGVANEIYNNGQEYERAMETLGQALKTKDTTIVRKAREDLKRIRNMYKPEPLKVPEWFGEEIETPKKTNIVSQNNTKKSTNVQQAKESVDTKTNSQTKDNNGLLYSGVYTISGECYRYETKKYIDCGSDSYVEIKIYEDYIIVKNSAGEEKKYDYSETKNGWKCYKYVIVNEDFIGRFHYEKYIVDSNYNVAKIDEYIQYTDKFKTYITSMAKGKKKMPRHKNN